MGNLPWLTTSAGIKMPGIIYGTAWKKDRTAELVIEAASAGFRGIDTAGQPKHYNEKQVGDALQILKTSGIEREGLFLQTKFTPLAGQDPENMPYERNASLQEQIVQSVESSLVNLQTGYIDSLILHSPMHTQELTMVAWDSMQSLYREGKVKQLGISNCYYPEVFFRLVDAAEEKPAVLQNRFYRDSDYDRVLREYCRKNGIIYQSFWTLTANKDLLASRTVREIAEKSNRTEAQVFFRFLSQLEIVPLTGTTSRQHMKEDLAIFDFSLSEDEIYRLKKMLHDS